MKLKIEDVEKIASLSKLKISEKDKNEILNSMNELIDYYDMLNELDTKNVEPLVFLNENKNILRNDIAKDFYDNKTFNIDQAPSSNSDFFKIPNKKR